MNSDSDSSENDSKLSGLGRALLGTNEGSKPSGPWVPPTAEELHKILPQYEIVKMLGRGGMGAVYMGTQTALDRPVAIKILSAALEDSDAGFAERFKNEARAMAKLNHPGIVSVYDFGEAPGGLLYIVMEYVDGTDVARMIAGKGRLHTEHAMAISAHVCDALAYAHERGIIHRDIKPANIMVGYDGTVKVADFGLAKVNVGGNTLGLTQSGMAMGTLHYMAPEALMLGASVDHRADIYAVGVMLYQMLSGKVPHGMFQMPSFTVPGLDPRYDRIIQKAMMEDREARYQSARELRGDLDGILTQPVVKLEAEASQPAAALPTQARPQRPGGQPYRPQQPQRPSPPAVQPPKKAFPSGLVATLLLLAGAAWFFFFSPKEASNSGITAGAVPPASATTQSLAQIRVITPDPVRILKLEKGQPRLYDSTPLRVIEGVAAELNGWQFISIPQRVDNEYTIQVEKAGVIYAFGAIKKGATPQDVLGSDQSRWEDAQEDITGAMVKFCHKRSVTAGETLKLKAFELQLAAHKITLQVTPASVPPVVATASTPTVKPAVPQPTGKSTKVVDERQTTASSKAAIITDTTGWQPLFPTDSLAGWKGDVAGYRLANGILTSTDKGGDLISPREYGNFHLKFDLRLSSGGNNGIGIWCADNAQGYKFVGHTGFEIQLIDDASPTYTKGDPWHLHGALSFFLSPKAKPMRPVGTWNTHEIRMEGTRLTVIINNVAVIDRELPAGDPEAKGSRRHRLDLAKKRGHLVFCGMKGPVDFRNVMIRDLDAEKAAAPTNPTIAASAATWIDTKGRNLSARFVQVEGGNVILDIAGRKTQVALNTLSAASQDIARQLAASSPVTPPSGTAWLEGRWLQFEHGGPDTGYVVDYLPDNIVMFKGGNIDGIGRWTLKGDSITHQWPRGNIGTTTFTLSADRKSMAGSLTMLNQEPIQVRHTKLAEAVAAPALLEKELEGRLFDFGWIAKDNPSASKLVLSTIRLLPNGRFEVVKNDNEANWDIRGGKLLFKHADGNVTTTFDRCYKLGDQWLFVGKFHPNAGIHHLLREQFEMSDAAK